MAVTRHRIVSGDDSEIHDEPHIEGSRVTVLHIHERVENRGLRPETVAERLNLDLADVCEVPRDQAPRLPRLGSAGIHTRTRRSVREGRPLHHDPTTPVSPLDSAKAHGFIRITVAIYRYDRTTACGRSGTDLQ